jgi:hypothetical protein
MEKWPSTQIKLCDFGLSRVLTNQRLLEMSGTTDFLGKKKHNRSFSFYYYYNFYFKHLKLSIMNH